MQGSRAGPKSEGRPSGSYYCSFDTDCRTRLFSSVFVSSEMDAGDGEYEDDFETYDDDFEVTR